MTYSRSPVTAPRLGSPVLRVLAPLAEAPVVGPLIRASMLKESGVLVLRDRVVPFPPAVVPELPHLGSFKAPAARPVVDAVPDEPLPGFNPVTAAALHDAYKSGRAHPLGVAERAVAAIDQSEHHDPPLRLFIAHDRDDVRRQAEASAARWRENKPLSALDGVPVVIKDEVDMVPYPTTAGTRFWGKQPATTDASTVARLRAAGAVLLGKANMHELGMGVTGVNPHHGAVRNPYDPACFTGGSSSGTAATVAAGISPVGLGADGGGSIRVPAALCGVVGLKATFGRVSEHGAAPLCWSVAHVGPIGATARDVALAYSVMAGPDGTDPRTRLQPPLDLHDFSDPDLSGVTLGIHTAWFEDADPDVVKAARATLEGLKVLGARVVEVEVPHLDLVRPAHLATIVSEMAVARAAHFPADRDQYGLDIRMNMALAETLTSVDYVQAQRVRTATSVGMEHVLSMVDALVTPTTSCVAQPIPWDALQGDSNLALIERIMRFIQMPNLTGHPAISFPAGYGDRGMPVGLHVVGRPWDEALLLRVAHAAERFVERKKPRWHVDLLNG